MEFCPTAYITGCLGLLVQFMTELLKDGEKRYPKYVKQRRFLYYPIDTLQQYKDIFTEMRRRTSATGTSSATAISGSSSFTN